MKKITLLVLILSISTYIYSQVGSTCATAYPINALPFTTSASTDSTGDNYDTICGSTFSDENDFLLEFTPATDMYIDVALTNTSVYTGLFITNGCPDAGTCVDYNEGAVGNPSLQSVFLQAGNTYYFTISTFDVGGLGFNTNTAFTININEVPPYDASVVVINSPNSGCSLTNTEAVACVVENVGADSIYNFNISYSINGAAPITETITDTILPSSNLNYTFTTTANLSSNSIYSFKIYTSLIGDTIYTNDTLTTNVSCSPTYSIFPYIDSLEATTWWTSEGTNSSWELGTPAGTVINSAASGSNSWVTNLTGNHNASETSYIVGPCFDFTSLTKPRIEFNLWHETQAVLTSMSFEYSIDNGVSWITLSAGSANQNWSNSWNGSSAGWIHVSNTVPSLAGIPSVKFRYAFSGLNSNNEGVAIDDISISECTLGDPVADFTFVISNETHVQFTNASTGATSYTWNFGDFQSSTDVDPAHDYLSLTNTYTVTLIAQNDCGSDTMTHPVDVIIVGVNKNSTDNNIKIYPNPASTYVQLESGKLEVESYAIYNVYGQKQFTINNKQSTIDISQLQKGLYFIKLQTNKGQVVSRFIKE